MPEHTQWEAKAANLLKAELKRKGVTYAQLVERLAAIGVDDKEVNIRNKLSRGKFTAAFFFAMSKGDRGAIFAIGLGAGVGLALLFFVWAFPWFSDPSQDASYCHPDDQHCAEQYQKPDDPHFWVRPFHGWFFAEDSLAQWLMAGFGVLATGVSLWAVILLRDTLDQSRKATKAAVASSDAANEANAIMRAEQRPWLAIIGNPGSDLYKVDVKNFGKLPAYNVGGYIRIFTTGEHVNSGNNAVRLLLDEIEGFETRALGGAVLFGGETTKVELLDRSVTPSAHGPVNRCVFCVAYQRYKAAEIFYSARSFSLGIKGDWKAEALADYVS